MPMKPNVIIQTPCPPALVCDCSTQVIVDDTIEIPPQKPEKEQVIDFRVAAEITNWDVIETSLGPKVIVSGTVTIGIEYVANMPDQPVHFAHWVIPWHTYVQCTAGTVISDVSVCIEYADYQQLDPRHLDKLIVLFVCVNPA